MTKVSGRPDAAACLEHPWFKKHEAAPPPLSVGITQCLEAYAGQPELKKAIFLLIAHMCTAPALGELRSIFTHFDTLNQGSLVSSDFREVLYKSGMSSLQVERIVHALDQDHFALLGVRYTSRCLMPLSLSIFPGPEQFKGVVKTA